MATHNWQFSFPWLSLGNVFSYTSVLVQWYECTGVAGGSLWVVLVNYKLYTLISTWKEEFYLIIMEKYLT
jgi:apolipoprotein N-acyltransferase